MKRDQDANGSSSIKREEQVVGCGNCHAKDSLFLHNIRQRGLFRRFCTDCVLKTHPGLFCPICLEVFTEPPPPRQRLTCIKCPAICHLSCPSKFSNESTFVCPACYNSKFNFFDVHPYKKLKSSSDNESSKDEDLKFIGREASKALRAAAKLSAGSMCIAAASSKADVERKAKESAQARKRAKEALERLAFLAAQEEREISREYGGLLLKGPVAADTERNALVEVKESNGVHSVSPGGNAARLQNLQSSHGMQH